MQELLLSLLENIEENWLKTTFTNCLLNKNFKSIIIETNFEVSLICYLGYFIQIYTDLDPTLVLTDIVKLGRNYFPKEL